jgi:O-antigen/teichoic acid export membrane protein
MRCWVRWRTALTSNVGVSRRIAHNTVVQLTSKGVTAVSGILLLAIITRTLGLSGYGNYATILAYTQFFAVFSDLGINVYAVKRLSIGSGRETEEAASMFTLRVLSGGVILGAAAIIVRFMPYAPAVKEGIEIVLFAMFAQTLNSLFVSVLQSRLEMQYAAFSEVAGRIAILALTALSVVLKGGLMGIVLATTAGNILNAAITYFYANRFVCLRVGLDWGLTQRIFNDALPIGVTGVLSYVYFKVDSVILSAIRIPGKINRVEVGIYGAAYKVVDQMVLVPTIFLGNIFPVLTSYLATDRTKAEALLRRAFVIMALVSFPVTAILNGYATKIIVFVAGASFAPAAVPLRILAFAIMLTYFNGLFTYTALALNRQKSLIWVYGLAAIGNAVSNFVLIPRYSYVAASYTTLATEAFVLIGAWLVSRDAISFRFPWAKSLHFLVIALIVAVFLHYSQRLEVLAGIFAAGLIYGGLAILTGAVSIGEIRGLLARPD